VKKPEPIFEPKIEETQEPAIEEEVKQEEKPVEDWRNKVSTVTSGLGKVIYTWK